jgi:hypothetical protein
MVGILKNKGVSRVYYGRPHPQHARTHQLEVHDDLLALVSSTIPCFDGNFDPHAYIEWELKVEKEFESTDCTTSSASARDVEPFLGHVISLEGIVMDPSKVQDVLEWQPQRTVHQVHSFLRLASYYRRIIPNCSKISKPITELLKKGTKYI